MSLIYDTLFGLQALDPSDSRRFDLHRAADLAAATRHAREQHGSNTSGGYRPTSKKITTPRGKTTSLVWLHKSSALSLNSPEKLR